MEIRQDITRHKKTKQKKTKQNENYIKNNTRLWCSC